MRRVGKIVLVITASNRGGVSRFADLFQNMMREHFEVEEIQVNNPAKHLASFKPIVRLLPLKIRNLLAGLFLGGTIQAGSENSMRQDSNRNTLFLFTHPRQVRQVDVPLNAKRLVMYHDSAENFIKSGVLSEYIRHSRKSDTLILLSEEDVMRVRPLIHTHVVCIENPLDQSLLSGDALAHPQKGHKRFLMLTRFVAQKRVVTALRAWKKSKIHKLGYELHIFGEGWRKTLATMWVSVTFTFGVKFMGFTTEPTKELRDSAFLLNSSRHEGLPFSYLEALVCGVPIVATPSGSGANRIVRGQSGLLADSNSFRDLAKKIQEAATLSTEQLEKISFNSSAMVENYSQVEITNRWLDLINSK